MITTASLVIFVLALATLVAMGLRDSANMRAARGKLLDQCASLLDKSRVEIGRDLFPKVSGKYRGHRVVAELIPDTMTIRRLPQLWLSVTQFDQMNGVAGFALLVRPAGTEFYSLTSQFTKRLQPARTLPDEILAQGESNASQALLDRVTGLLADICADPKIKEVAVTSKGVRVIWQAAEGRRGEHLLLRQSQFDGADVSRGDFSRLLSHVAALRDVIKQASRTTVMQ